MLLSQIRLPLPDGKNPNSAPTIEGLKLYLTALQSKLSYLGWTTYGSIGKTPNLVKRSVKDKVLLDLCASNDLQYGPANSINLNLKASNVIALDCDFHSLDLTRYFIANLVNYMGLSMDRLFTCVGAKGCKIFFRYAYNLSKSKLPTHLGKTAYINQIAPDYKQELEIKTDLSTVAGIHSQVITPYGTDYIVYTYVQGTRYIVEASPQDLPFISWEELMHAQTIYTGLLAFYDAKEKNGLPIYSSQYQVLVKGAVAAYFLKAYSLARDLAMARLSDTPMYVLYAEILTAPLEASKFNVLCYNLFLYVGLAVAWNVRDFAFLGGTPPTQQILDDAYCISSLVKQMDLLTLDSFKNIFVDYCESFMLRIIYKAKEQGIELSYNGDPLDLFFDYTTALEERHNA